MKFCRKCGEWKNETEFNKNRRRKDGLQDWCRECNIASSRKNRREKRTVNNKRDYIYALKRPCQKCGEKRLYLIQFHHIDPKTKNFEVSQFRHFSMKKCEEESKKCVCLCSNCHDEFHYMYGQNPKNPIESIEEYLNTK